MERERRRGRWSPTSRRRPTDIYLRGKLAMCMRPTAILPQSSDFCCHCCWPVASSSPYHPIYHHTAAVPFLINSDVDTVKRDVPPSNPNSVGSRELSISREEKQGVPRAGSKTNEVAFLCLNPQKCENRV